MSLPDTEKERRGVENTKKIIDAPLLTRWNIADDSGSPRSGTSYGGWGRSGDGGNRPRGIEQRAASHSREMFHTLIRCISSDHNGTAVRYTAAEITSRLPRPCTTNGSIQTCWWFLRSPIVVVLLVGLTTTNDCLLLAAKRSTHHLNNGPNGSSISSSR